ncbi:MAG TPA: hypothetical protein DIT07_08845 [Sphingobacteriaceae bacterium]|nr:hypothetical protein [Sphingobacteriaceae bacterium]
MTNVIISGTVLEAGTDKPISNVSIYFDGTLNGTSTNKVGSFSLYPQANTKIPLIISAVGYDTETITDYPLGKKLIIYLKAKTYDLDAITITASDGMSREEKLKVFRREFLGTSYFARNCEIENESDIHLTYNKQTKTVKAFCDNPVIVRNKNLGYTFNFILQAFTSSAKGASFYGPQFFKEDITEVNANVARARERAYLGSRMHFIRSLWNNDLVNNDFEIYRERAADLNYDSIVVSYGGQKYIRLKSTIGILYKGRPAFVFTDTPGKDIFIDKDGYNDPVGINWGGDIGRQRTGDMLPLEYKTSKPPVLSQAPVDAGVKEIIAYADTLRKKMPAEKLYMQFDKPYYSVGDTLWLKAYLFNTTFLSASKSGIVYIELANDTNKVLMRRMIRVVSGLGFGNIVLNKEEIPEGSYTITAYTNLMRNFDESIFFKRSFYVSGTGPGNWLVNSNVVLSERSGKDSLHLSLQFNKLDKQSLGLHELDVRVQDDKHVLLRDKLQTDVHGALALNFSLPEKSDPRSISIIVGDMVKGQLDHQITIPILVNRPENIDLQFMPEGGDLLSGISSRVGFKAIGEDGKAVTVSGKIYSGSQEVGSFNSSYKGMGSFEFTPIKGLSYTAKITSPSGVIKEFKLPAVKSAGTAMRVNNNAETDSIEVIISSNLPKADYYLIAQSRGVVCYGITISGNETKRISKSLFPTGIATFSLLNANRHPLNERITFINQKDNLKIAVSSSKANFGTRDSIKLDILVTDKDNLPVQGSFSLAVTDDDQIKIDSLRNNMLTSLLLTSDLKGNVENPGYYFQRPKDTAKDLDNLLMTQGWTEYNWKNVFDPTVPLFGVEWEFAVQGYVTNILNKPLPTIPVQLVSTKPGFAFSNLTAKDGSFTFAGFPIVDTLTLFIQAKNKNNKSFNVGVNINKYKPPVLASISQRIVPWYVNSDSSLLNYVKTGIQQKQEEINLSGSNMLSEVTIAAKKIIKYSKNLNGPGASDFAVEEKEILKAGKSTLNDLLLKKVSNLRVKDGKCYVIGELITHLIIDGIDIEFAGGIKKLIPPAQDLKEYFDNIDAQDIKGIEIMSSPKYQFAYKNEYLHDPRIDPLSPLLDPTRHAWIEVTTRGGNGPFLKKGTGVFVYRPLLFVAHKQFYSPKYATKSPVTVKDLRSTIHWEPNVVTDGEGKAQVSFYSADSPGTYSIIIEGSDMNGNIGRETGSIIIR